MSRKRPIDIQREAAFSLRISGDDESEIVEPLITLGSVDIQSSSN